MTTSTSTALVRADTGEVVPGAVAPFDMATFLATIASPQHVAQQQKLAAAYDAACAAIIGPNDVQVEGPRSFKKKSAWRKLGRYFQISTEVRGIEQSVLDGVFIARVTVRAIAPWGQYADALGACGTDEATGRRTITIADAIATAETRATNRAVSNLVAMGEVSAEEIGNRKPLEDGPRRQRAEPAGEPAGEAKPQANDGPACPKCGGPMYDDRQSKRNPRAPDFKCKNKQGCDGVIWPPKEGEQRDATGQRRKPAPAPAARTATATYHEPMWAIAAPDPGPLVPEEEEDYLRALEEDEEELPF